MESLMDCYLNLAQIVLHELITNNALTLVRSAYYLKVVLSNEIAYEIARAVKAQCNLTIS